MKCLIAFAALLICSTGFAETTKHDFGEAAEAEIYKKASGDDLWIYRFEPEGHDPEKDKRPAIVFFFGGGWNGGKVTQFEQHSRYLAKRGMVAFVADYRVKSRQKTSPLECVYDGKSAVRWIRQNAARLGIDPERIAAGGGSAGAHVAAAAGMCDEIEDPADDKSVSSKPRALCLFNPVYNNGPGNYGQERVEEWFPQISPAHCISKDDPPAIVFLGSEDDLIPVATAEKYRDDMTALGLKSELYVYEGQSHGFFNQARGDETFIDTILKMDAFLVGEGLLEEGSDETFLKTLLKPKRVKEVRDKEGGCGTRKVECCGAEDRLRGQAS